MKRKKLIEIYSCIDPPYDSQKSAIEAREKNYRQLGTQYQRDIWICLDGHWHEGILDN